MCSLRPRYLRASYFLAYDDWHLVLRHFHNLYIDTLLILLLLIASVVWLINWIRLLFPKF